MSVLKLGAMQQQSILHAVGFLELHKSMAHQRGYAKNGSTRLEAALQLFSTWCTIQTTNIDGSAIEVTDSASHSLAFSSILSSCRSCCLSRSRRCSFCSNSSSFCRSASALAAGSKVEFAASRSQLFEGTIVAA